MKIFTSILTNLNRIFKNLKLKRSFIKQSKNKINYQHLHHLYLKYPLHLENLHHLRHMLLNNLNNLLRLSETQ